jgi:AbrB family looped-hinge helix DNA binding protein
METKVSTKGQVVLPSPLRQKLGLRPGDSLDVDLAGDAIILTPRRARTQKATVLRDAITGLPVLSAGKGAPKLTNEQVRELLAGFP